MATPRSQRLPFAVAAFLGGLLVALAVLQWRWIGEVSATERQRMLSGLVAAGSRFAADFDREITRVFLHFHPGHAGSLADAQRDAGERLTRWQEDAPYPELVRALYLVRPGPVDGPALELLRPAEERFVAVPWPRELGAVRGRFLSERRDAAPWPAGSARAVVAQPPAVLVPLAFDETWRMRFGAPGRHGRGVGPPSLAEQLAAAKEVTHSFFLVVLDERVLIEEVLPALMREHFGSAAGVDYVVAVAEAEAGGRALYLSDPAAPPDLWRSPDLRLELFGLRAFEELHALWPDRGPGPGGRRPAERGPGIRARHGGPSLEGHPHGAWVLLAQRREGSLERAVAVVRRRNVTVSAGILGLLGAALGFLVVSTQRAQRLARQQIEFVAGVTHELHTPLAAIRAAGENLADGVVSGDEPVRRYGRLIESEGRRLSAMVGQALEMAGIHSGRRVYRIEAHGVAELVDGALADNRWLLEEAKMEVARQVEPGLPPVAVDAAALRRALSNLIENAVKYGGPGRRVVIAAGRGAPGEVRVAVVDRGPGIEARDLAQLFEPFFRGAAANGVAGSGLGLSLVQQIVRAHGGRVTVESRAGEGTTFTLHLPAAAEGEGP